ncbi:hypothetical protein L0222_32835 [bacterium]|nr:hypothetical protein [bacterium]
MFAGAVREAVFSNPEVIRRANAEFVPVSVSARFFNHPGDEEEVQLLRSIGRSSPAPQGLCVLNSSAQVLHWTLMFDDEKSIQRFLDYSLERFRKYPDGKQPILTERYMKFPSLKLNDFRDESRSTSLVEHHPRGGSCPAESQFPRGSVAARVVGRKLDGNGKLSADTVNQEHYAQDRFIIPPGMQEAIANAFANSGTGPRPDS